MKFVKLFIISFFFCYSAQSQIYQPINTPLKWKIGGFDSMFIPSHDTIKPKDPTKAWITLKNGVLFNWNNSALKWDSLKGGAGGGETTSGTVAELRALSTTTGRSYTLTGDGGGPFTDVGLTDGQYVDDGSIYINTANGHTLKRDIDGDVNVKWFGAVGNGIAQDSGKINKALAFCKANKHPLYFPAGSYLYTGVMMIDQDLISISGEGRDLVFIKLGSAASKILIKHTLYGTGRSIYRPRFTDITVDGQNIALIPMDFQRCEEPDFTNFAVTQGADANINAELGGLFSFNNIQNVNAPVLFRLKGVGSITANFTNFWNCTTVLECVGDGSVGHLDFKTFWAEKFTTLIKLKGVAGVATVGTIVIDGKYNSTQPNATLFDIESAATRVAAEKIDINGSLIFTNTTKGIFSFENKTDVIGTIKINTNILISTGTTSSAIVKFGASTPIDLCWVTLNNVSNPSNIPLYTGVSEARVGGYTNSYNNNLFSNGVTIGTDPNNGRLVNYFGNIYVSVGGVLKGFLYNDTDIPVVTGSPNYSTKLTTDGNVVQGPFFHGTGTTFTTDDLVPSNTNGQSLGELGGSRFKNIVGRRGEFDTLNVNSLIGPNIIAGTGTLGRSTRWNGTTTMTNGGLFDDGTGSIGIGAAPASTAKLEVDVTSKQYGLRAHASAGDPTITLADATNSYSMYMDNTNHDVGLYHWNASKFRMIFKGDDGRMGINTTTPDPSSIMQVTSTTKGVLFPIVPAYLKTAIASPANSLFLYDETAAKFSYYSGGLWRYIMSDQDIKDSLNARDVLNTFIMRNAGGSGDSLMKIVTPGSHVAFKRVIMNGIISKAITDTTITYNIGGTGVNGTVSFTGNGSSTSFTIPLSSVAGLSATSKIFLTAKTAIGAALEWVEADTESITVHYLTAPTSGAKTLNYFIVP